MGIGFDFQLKIKPVGFNDKTYKWDDTPERLALFVNGEEEDCIYLKDLAEALKRIGGESDEPA